MKALEEVIKALDICTSDRGGCGECPYDPDCKPDRKWDDALFYLKEYRKNKDGLESKRQILDFKIKMFGEQTELVQQQGKELEERCQAEIARYQEAVKNCEKAENKYRILEDELNGIRREHIEQMKNPDGDHQQLKKARELLQDFYRNDPLTWEQLKQMEGKPVWVEEYGREYATPHWEIHSGIEKGYDGDEILYLEPFETFTKNDMGKTWQAYRKERA